MQSFSALHAMARAYAEAGIPVFPCEAGGKKPVTENGFHDSTTDLTIIDAWWGQNENYNLAVCPANAGWFVVDIDPGADAEIYSRLPSTYTVTTPRGGKHLYYEGTGRTTAGKLAAHIDTRSVGGYVLVPPSTVGGVQYALANEIDYAPIPQWVKEKLAVIDAPVKSSVNDLDIPANILRARTLLQGYVKRGDVAVEGRGGDERTYRLCCELLELGLSHYTAKDLLEEIWNPHCEPSWNSDELDIKFKNASSYQQNEQGAYGVQSSEQSFGEAAAKLSNDTPQKKSRFYFKDETELDEEPDPKWMVKDLISEQSTVMLFGTSGSYKSFMALDIALAIATGEDTFGSKTDKGAVFYSMLEGKAHLKKARRAWRALKAIEGKIDNFYLGRAPMVAIDSEVQEFGDEIAKRCAGRTPKLIVIDTLSKSMSGLNENDASDANRFITFCDSLVEAFKCSVMAVHHSSDKESARGARGSSAFFAGFDTVLEVKAHKAGKAVAVYVRKHKDAEEREKPWTFEGRVTGPSLTFEATTPEQHRLLTGESKDLIGPKAIGTALKELGAFGEDAGVSTAVLATQVTPAREDESVEDRGDAISRTGRALAAGAKGTLEPYCIRRGKELVWHLPAPAEK